MQWWLALYKPPQVTFYFPMEDKERRMNFVSLVFFFRAICWEARWQAGNMCSILNAPCLRCLYFQGDILDGVQGEIAGWIYKLGDHIPFLTW